MEPRFLLANDETSRESTSASNTSERTASSIASELSKGKRGKNRIYFFSSEHESLEEAASILSLEKIWSKTRVDKTHRYYRCNLVTYRNPVQCAAAVYIYLHEDSNKVSIYRTLCKQSKPSFI